MSSADFKVNEDKLMGPYFIARKVIERGDTTEFIKVFTSKVIMYLYEDAVKQRKIVFLMVVQTQVNILQFVISLKLMA